MNKVVQIGSLRISNALPFVLIGGPCVIESEKHAFAMAVKLKSIAAGLKIPYIFKSSYDKANRSSMSSFRGPGLREGLRILARVRYELKVPVLTDIHTAEEAVEAGQAVDVVQIPAFLCRQTDLLLAAGRTGVAVNIKKGQFMSPWEMKNAVAKVESTGNRRVLLTERGNSFGYNNLVVDMRGLAIMKTLGHPVIYDATHSVQLPGGQGHASGGQREFVMPLARAAIGLGIAGLFMEIHPVPEKALSDGPNSVRLSDLKRSLVGLRKLDAVSKEVKDA